MALIEFKNKPNTDTPINDINLNHNFKEIEINLTEVTEELSETNKKLIKTDSKNDYLTTEQVIGTYKGKLLYRKILVIGEYTFTNGDNLFAHGIANFERAIDIKYSMYFASGKQWYTYWSPITSNIATGSNVILAASVSNTFYNLEITIEYTKTS